MSRLFISRTSDWELVDVAQDMRGFVALDGAGVPVGRVEAMIADTDAEIVSAILLDTGDEVPMFDVTLGDGVVYLAGSVPGAATATRPEDVAHRGIAPRTVVVVPEPALHAADFRAHHASRESAAAFDAVEAAYHSGYAAAHAEAHRNRAFDAAEPDIRDAYPPERDFDAEREAVRYGYARAQNAGR